MISRNTGKGVKHLKMKFCMKGIWHPSHQHWKKRQIINSRHAQNSCGCDVHTNYIQEMGKEARWTSNIRHAKGIQSARGYEGDGGTGLRQPHKTIKKGGTMCNKLNKIKKVWKIKGKVMCRWKATNMIHT